MEENLVTTEKNSISALSERTEHVLESLILKKTIYTYNYHFEDGELDSFLKKSLKYWKSSGNGQLVMKNLKESELDIFPPLADYTERVCFSYTKQCELIYFLGHIRNSLAHGRFNVVGTKKDPIIIMEDKNSSGNCSARMILHLSTMNKWISLFESRFGIDNN